MPFRRVLPQIALHFAAKRSALCGKTQPIMPQNAMHYAAKRDMLCRKAWILCLRRPKMTAGK